MSKCSLCTRAEVDENAPILTMSAYGNPRYICDDCARDLDDATSARDYSIIKSAFDRLGEKIASQLVIDDFVNDTLQEVMSNAAERAEKIKNGEYDFTLDEATDEGEMDDVPEELLETEEDRKKDERDEERARKLDRILNIAFAVSLIAVVAYALYKFLG